MIRPATLEDAPAIARAHVRTWREAFAGLIPPGFLTGISYEQRRARWETSLAENRETVLVEEQDNGEIAGMIAFGPSHDPDRDGSETAEVYILCVAPEFWRRHVGASLMAEAERRMQRIGLRRISVWVLAEHAVGRRFCEKAGYRPDGATREDRYRSERRKAQRYSKRLPNPTLPAWVKPAVAASRHASAYAYRA